MAEQTKIIYDINILVNHELKAGIYYTTLNILREFLNREDVNVVLYSGEYYDGIEELKSIFPDKDLNIVIQKGELYSRLKKLKEKSNGKFQKILLKLVLLLSSIVLKPLNKLYLHFKLKDYNAFFSPIYKIKFKKKNLKKYVFIHDVIPKILPEYFSPTKMKWINELYGSLNDQDNYLVNSECTKNDLMQFFQFVKPEQITVTPLACREIFKPSVKQIREKYSIPSKYIFSLCTLEPRKNLIRAVKTFIEFINKNNIDDLVFVLGGGSWDFFIEKLEKEINFDQYKDKIIKAGFVEEKDLPSLYSGAEWFVYTSQYEGFGLPPLEAMSCGCPVITSNNSSLPEVVGDGGILIDWDSDEQHIKAYEKYYYNPELRREYSMKGLERSKIFSWQKCADEIIKVIKNG